MIKMPSKDGSKEREAKARTAAVAAVKGWTEAALPAYLADEVVMVSELRCGEPGCPPLETAVSILRKPKPLLFKVHKAVGEVGEEELLASMRSALAAEEPAPEQPASEHDHAEAHPKGGDDCCDHEHEHDGHEHEHGVQSASGGHEHDDHSHAHAADENTPYATPYPTPGAPYAGEVPPALSIEGAPLRGMAAGFTGLYELQSDRVTNGAPAWRHVHNQSLWIARDTEGWWRGQFESNLGKPSSQLKMPDKASALPCVASEMTWQVCGSWYRW